MTTTSQPRSKVAGKLYSTEWDFTCPGAGCGRAIKPTDRVIVEEIWGIYNPRKRYMVFHVICHPRVVERRFKALARRFAV